MMSKDMNTMRLPRFWGARPEIPSPSCTRHASDFVNRCKKRFAVMRGRNANQRADYLFRNIMTADSSGPKPESNCAGKQERSIGRNEPLGERNRCVEHLDSGCSNTPGPWTVRCVLPVRKCPTPGVRTTIGWGNREGILRNAGGHKIVTIMSIPSPARNQSQCGCRGYESSAH